MDVKTDEGATPPEHATIVFERPANTGQFPAVRGPSYDDTDQLPAVARERYRGDGTRVLRIAIGVVVAAILLAAAGLGLVKSGVLHKNTAPPPKTVTHHSAVIPTNAPLVTQTSTGAGSATYSIPIKAYVVTVTTTTGRSWLSIGMNGAKPVYAGILPPGQSQRELILGTAQIDIGAGGTSLTITSGSHTQVLKPPTAPFSYTITPSD
jgi:hypothetical protein